MGDFTMSLPTLLVLVPAAGGLVSMAMVTRRAAGIAALLTALVQAACIVLGVSSLRDGVPGGVQNVADDRIATMVSTTRPTSVKMSSMAGAGRPQTRQVTHAKLLSRLLHTAA